MATSVQTYSGMLAVQADMAFPLERSFFETNQWHSAKHVGDFGSGNCAYVARLHDKYPGKVFECVETSADMRHQASQWIGNRPINLSSTEEPIADSSLDFLLFRLVLLHLPDRSQAYAFAHRSLKPQGSLLVIDADDENFFISPPPSRFLAALSALRSKSKDRNLRSRLDSEVEPFGFKPVLHHRLIVNSDGKLAKLQMYLYMKLTAEQALNGSREIDIEDELIQWYLDSRSYAQYGIFGTLYKAN